MKISESTGAGGARANTKKKCTGRGVASPHSMGGRAARRAAQTPKPEEVGEGPDGPSITPDLRLKPLYQWSKPNFYA